ncbi:alpha/beta hydrolase [Sphingosinicella sp. BN140058]|uniref:alpha/beta hydrolase n=1 Tax=Sphingosinicella sp. BN140058 TaxID=1892855 RepID=UPI001012C104|nr:alpha/beta hydrolase [Sphingosinicella sp. BN140058]QAY75756.1 alpha/beta hydrolase [Sphingosinicella sp. BN140058]
MIECSRRTLVGAIALLAAMLSSSAFAAAETVTVKAGDRDLVLSVWRPDKARAVILFSHGGGGAPDAYEKLIETWRRADFLVVAPLHTDSKMHAGADHSLQSAFATRIADIAAAEAWAAAAAPGLPLAAAGHSYGALTAMISGGALDSMVHARSKRVGAIIALSSPGPIPGLIGPASFATLDKPLLLFTGDADTIPGFAPDWKAHLAAFETSAAGAKYVWIGKGATHMLATGDPTSDRALADAAALSVTFLQAQLLGDQSAREILNTRKPTGAAEFRKR